jgi:SAM-dependent methyltransferase
VTGVDLSEDQLRIARDRAGEGAELVRADAADLPFDDDVGDFAAVLGEAVRVLRPRGRLVYLGPHPCFVGPHSRFVEAKGLPTLHPGYRETGRYTDAPGISPTGLRGKVGAVHLPRGDLLQTFLRAGLRIDEFEEPICAGREYPHWLALRASR